MLYGLARKAITSSVNVYLSTLTLETNFQGPSKAAKAYTIYVDAKKKGSVG